MLATGHQLAAVMAGLPSPAIISELVAFIVDQCDYDVKELQACSFVSRVWARESQRRLFSAITISGRPQFNMFSFFRLISENPHIRASIKDLTIRDEISTPEVIQAVSSLPCLQSLELGNTILTSLSSGMGLPSASLSPPFTLDRLFINGCELDSQPDEPLAPLVELLSAFSSVHGFCLASVSVPCIDSSDSEDSDNDPPETSPRFKKTVPHKVNIRHLEIYDAHSPSFRDIFRPLRDLLDFSQLCDLQVGEFTNDRMSEAQEVIDVATNVEHLSIELYRSSQDGSVPPLSLNSCRSLKSLNIAVKQVDDFAAECSSAIQLVETLAPTTPLENVRFEMVVHGNEIDCILQSRWSDLFSQVRKVEIGVTHRFWASSTVNAYNKSVAILDSIKSQLPSLNRQRESSIEETFRDDYSIARRLVFFGKNL